MPKINRAMPTPIIKPQSPFASTSLVQVVVDVVLSAHMGTTCPVFPGRSAVRSVWDVGLKHIGRRIAPLLAIAPKRGVVGTLRSTWSRSWLAAICARLLKEHDPDCTFTSVYLSNSLAKDMHVDVSNLLGSQNYILPLCLPKRGGDIWVELGCGDVVTGPVVDHVDARGKMRHGVVHRLDEDEVFQFNPKRYHFVTPFKGTRVVMVGYTADVLGKASTDA